MEAATTLRCDGTLKNGRPCTYDFGHIMAVSPGGKFIFERPCPHCRKMVRQVFSDERIKTFAAKA